MRYKEDIVQIQIATYLRYKGFLFSATNGGVFVQSIQMKALLKRMGYLKGCPDLIVWIPGGTLCIEVKRPTMLKYSVKSGRQTIADSGGRQTEGQKEFEKNVKAIPGHHYIVADDVGVVENYMQRNGIKPT